MMSRLKKSYKINLLAVLLACFAGCDFIADMTKSDDREVIATCFDEKLYLEDIKAITSAHLSKEDSSMRVSAFIKDWITRSTLVHYANEDTLVAFKNIERQVADYKNQLIYHSYQRALIKKQLDTTVSEKEIQEYYEENKNQYALKSPAVKAIYFNIYRKQPSLPEVEKWLNSDQEGAIDSLIKYGKEVAQEQLINPEKWHYWEKIARNTPLENIDTETLVIEKKSLKESDDNTTHLVRLIDIRNKGEHIPLQLVSAEIKQHILTERKNKLLHSYKDSFLEKAHEKNAIEILH